MSTRNRIIIILFILGLIARIVTIPTEGSSDIGQYVKWGKNTAIKGLSLSFDGVYFPIQYYIFAEAHIISTESLIPTDKIIKIFNLIFEIGLLGLLILLTRKYIEPWKILTLYWLNPFSIIIFQEGYIDAQFSLFILLALFILNTSIKYRYFLAGIPLGIAFLMKPQALPIFIGLGILFMFHTYQSHRSKTRHEGLLWIFVPSLILFITFSLYFGLSLKIENHKTLSKISNSLVNNLHIPISITSIVADSTFLGLHYIHVPDVMPAINAQMPNTWYLVAKVLNTENKPIYRVSDKLKFIGITYRTIGLIIFLIILVIIIFKISKTSRSLPHKVILTICLAPILVPYLTTSAHENHFYLGFVTLIILGALLRDKFLLQSGYILGIFNATNIAFLYLIPLPWNRFYDVGDRIPLIIATSIVFFVLLYRIIKRSYSEGFEISKLTIIK